jgi:hypothetical protein
MFVNSAARSQGVFRREHMLIRWLARHAATAASSNAIAGHSTQHNRRKHLTKHAAVEPKVKLNTSQQPSVKVSITYAYK